MADKIVNLYEDPSTQTPIPVRFVDQGDGTWALKGSGGAGGGGGAVTVADGADVTQGAQADAAWVSGNGSVISILKNIATKLAGTVGVTGTFWQATQPVSAASLPLPSGASTAAKQPALGTAGTASADVLSVQGIASMTAFKVDGSATTQPVSASTLPLPTGAATAAKQPALGLAGTPSTDVLTVQGSATGQPLPTGGTTIAATDVFTRPADTVAYAVGDSVSATVSDTGTTPLRGIAVAGATGGTGYITKLRVWTDQAACVAAIRIHFYTVAQPPTAIPGDNVANGLFYGNFAKRIGSVDLPPLSTETSGNTAAHSMDASTRLAFVCDPADTKLYYRLQTQTAFTPASGQSFSLEFTSERNAT